jgi:hypothetical protein
MRYKRPLRQILSSHQDVWDHPGTRPVVRDNFSKVAECGTPSLGYTTYASSTETLKVCHRCKSRCCPSCGHRATLNWQREQWTQLPDVPYAAITLTMPDVLWPIFRTNRHLLHDLPALAAQVLKTYMQHRHGVTPCVIAVPHTFGRHLNFNSHVHVLISAGGLDEYSNRWVLPVNLDIETIRSRWRDAVVTYLRLAVRRSVLKASRPPSQLYRIIESQSRRRWIVHIDPLKSKTHFLRYVGRYVRRPPVAEHRFVKITGEEVVFWTKDLRLKRKVLTRYSVEEFISALSDHVPEEHEHAMRYFGLLAPQKTNLRKSALIHVRGEVPKTRPPRLTWRQAIIRSFGRDPLIDSRGEQMVRVQT